MCKFEENVELMTFENCNLFKRSFTTHGLGYTFNNEIENFAIKKNFRSTSFSPNIGRIPSLMKSTNSDHSLTVIIDVNDEEVDRYETSKEKYKKYEKYAIFGNSNENEIFPKPKEVELSIHNPKEPADTHFIPIKSVRVPLGYSTTIFINPMAREIDESGKALPEFKRKCRLETDTDDLDVFNVYTKIACLFECKMKYSMRRCGCIPWNYPIDMNDKVRSKLSNSPK